MMENNRDIFISFSDILKNMCYIQHDLTDILDLYYAHTNMDKDKQKEISELLSEFNFEMFCNFKTKYDLILNIFGVEEIGRNIKLKKEENKDG